MRREVMEEVGLPVKNIRFYKSQPWSFSSSLLSGFYCDLDTDDETVTSRPMSWGREPGLTGPICPRAARRCR